MMKNVLAPSLCASESVALFQDAVKCVSGASFLQPSTTYDNNEHSMHADEAVRIPANRLFVSPMAVPLTPRERALRIISRIAEPHGFTVEDMVGPSRRRPIIPIRFAAIRAVKAETGLSVTKIGRLFNRDHTSILYALGRRSDVQPSDMKVRAA